MLYECPVCLTTGLTSLPYKTWPPPVPIEEMVPPYEAILGAPSYEVCLACAFEFGNDDNPGTADPKSFAEYREDWIELGRPPLSGNIPYPDGAFCRLPKP